MHTKSKFCTGSHTALAGVENESPGPFHWHLIRRPSNVDVCFIVTTLAAFVSRNRGD